MGREEIELSLFETQRTPDVAERSGILYVPEKKFWNDTPTPMGTTLQDFMPGADKADAIKRGFGGYLLTGAVEAPPGYLGFSFAKPKTKRQRRRPFRSYTIQALHFWPDWMRALYAIEDSSVPYQVTTAGGSIYKDRVFDRVEFIDGGNYQSEILVEEFFSPVPFTAEELACETPQPTTVSYNYFGAQASYSCLHPLVIIPEQQRGARMVANFGTPNARARRARGDVFPATNLPGWDTHCFYNQAEETGGGWYRMQKTVTPMFIPEATYR